MTALACLTPSISESELQRYRQIQAHFSGQKIDVDKTSQLFQKLDFASQDFS